MMSFVYAGLLAVSLLALPEVSTWAEDQHTHVYQECICSCGDLEYLDEELSKSATVPLTGKRLVDVEKCLDIVSELRVTLPDDVKDAEVIVRDREQILADAQRQAEQIIADAQQQFEQMVSNHAIVQEAQRRANAIVKDAVAKADEEADSCTAYLNDVLGNVEQHLKRVLDDVHQNRLEVTSGGDGGNNAARGGR